MHFTYLTFISALAIGVVICGMALVPSAKAKALLYVLPIPISIGIIATHGKITSSHLIGLFLVWVFLRLTRFLADTLKLHILLADATAALSYVLSGYLTAQYIHLPFAAVACMFVTAWACCIVWIRAHPIKDPKPKSSTVPPAAKGAIASIVSFFIYSVQHALAGIVVTFPYNGIFAVVETRRYLTSFSRAVICNTLALAALFTTMYYLQTQLSLALNLVAGWIAFVLVLLAVRRIPLER